MRKLQKLFRVILFLFLILFIISCSNIFHKDDRFDYNELTVINNMNKFINFSIVEEYVTTENAETFYSSSHKYLSDYLGFVTFKRELLAPKGSISDEGKYELDKITYRIGTGSYNVTLFVALDNTYDYKGRPDIFVDKYYFNLSGNKTVIINENGKIQLQN